MTSLAEIVRTAPSFEAPPIDSFDWKNPDYQSVMEHRMMVLAHLRESIRTNPGLLPGLKLHYREKPWEFIQDWGMTFDPRNVERGLPAKIPFILFPKQIEWCKWVIDHWMHRASGLTEKSRDCGVSWLSVALGSTLCLFRDGLAIGYGSRKEEYVDRIDNPKSLFFKARMFMDMLPAEFTGGWDHRRNTAHMRISFDASSSYMTGEAGDNIGRGDRCAIYFVDEAAYLEHPELTEAALISTTNCRMDISSANGPSNVFAQKRHSMPSENVFTFHWRQDPRKDEDWYVAECARINNPIIVASELDIDYTASVEGVLIPNAWIQAAIGAAEKLGFEPTGIRLGALDVADEGRDNNAFCGAHGVVVQDLEQWSGKGGDIFQTVEKTFALCEERDYKGFRYDTDGLGAGVRGDAKVIQERRIAQKLLPLEIEAYRGSAEVSRPDSQDVKDRKNKDFFSNLKAQSWWSLRTRFLNTYRWIVDGIPSDPDNCISLDPKLNLLSELCVELSRPTYQINNAGKIVIDKTPEGLKSPDLADSLVIRFAPIDRRLVISPDAMTWARMPTRRRL